MSTFGTIFRVTTFGESHCKGVGAIIDGTHIHDVVAWELRGSLWNVRKLRRLGLGQAGLGWARGMLWPTTGPGGHEF